MRYAVIQHRRTRKPVAVLVHSAESGRVVIKCLPPAWPIQKVTDFWLDHPIIIQESKTVGETVLQVRRKVVRFDKDYLEHLLDRIVHRPYEVKKVVNSTSTIRIDNYLDQIAKEVL